MAIGDEPLYPTTAHPVYYDHKAIATGTYNSGTGKTTFTFTFNYRPLKGVVVATGKVFTPTLTSDTTCEVVGDYSGECMFGRPIYMDLYLSRVYPRDDQNRPLVDRRMNLRTITIQHRDTVAFDTSIQRRSETPAINSFRQEIGLLAYAVAEVGSQRSWIMSNCETTQIVIFNETCRPCTIIGVEYDAEYVEAFR